MDPVGDAAREIAETYYLARGSGSDHFEAIRHVLRQGFPDDPELQAKMETSFDNATWEDTELDEVKQLTIGILTERFTMPDNLKDALNLSAKVDRAYAAGPAHVYASRTVRRPRSRKR